MLNISVKAKIPGFNGIVFSVVDDVTIDTASACSDFVNLEDLLVQSSKMLIGVGFVYMRS